jgi:hypothetical protein
MSIVLSLQLESIVEHNLSNHCENLIAKRAVFSCISSVTMLTYVFGLGSAKNLLPVEWS